MRGNHFFKYTNANDHDRSVGSGAKISFQSEYDEPSQIQDNVESRINYSMNDPQVLNENEDLTLISRSL